MVDRDVVFAKVAIIERCLLRIKAVTRLDPESLDAIDVQEIFILNPQDLKENFRLLQEANVIAPSCSSPSWSTTCAIWKNTMRP
jgi:hypothetical protein